MSTIIKRAFAINLILSGVIARDHIVIEEKEADKRHTRPNVEDYACRKCLITNADTNICAAYGASW